MGIKKKRNVLIIAVIVIVSFILYQLYFFFAISSDLMSGNRIIVDHEVILKKLNYSHVKSKEDKYINSNGVIHGILSSNMIYYRSNEDNVFKCIKSDKYIPFERINDDFCDCEDGSDEPSTSACVNSVFYCDTQNRDNMNFIPSSKVNDGICDCCDGSDEWIRNTRLLTQGSRTLRRKFASKCLNIC